MSTPEPPAEGATSGAPLQPSAGDNLDQAASAASDSTAFAAGVATAEAGQATAEAAEAAATAEAAAATAEAAAEVASDAADTAWVTRDELDAFRSETDDRLGAIAAGQQEILARLSDPAPPEGGELPAPPEKPTKKTDRSDDAGGDSSGKDQAGGQPEAAKKGRADGFSSVWFGKG